MRLRGVIVVVGRIQSVILADDETMHSFSTSDWRSDEASLDVGTPVSFEIQDSNAVDVRPIADTAAAPDDALPDVVSQGTIRRVARADRPGMIEGGDGSEYTYTLSDWEVDSFNPIAGMRVDFAARGSSAASVRLPGSPPRASGATSVAPELSPKPSADPEEAVAPAPVPSESAADTAIVSQGTIRRVARADRLGVIQGDDGFQYTYTSEDWEPDSFNPIAGMRVDFAANGSLAASVRLPGTPPRTSSAANAGSPPAPRISPRASDDSEVAVAPAPLPSATAPDVYGDAVSDLDLRGTIRRVARADRPGMIEGDDGVAYSYTSADWGTDSLNPIAGMKVVFVPNGSLATSVRLSRTSKPLVQPRAKPRARRDVPVRRRRFPRKVIALALLILAVMGGAGAYGYSLWSQPPTADYWTTYAPVYAGQINAGRSPAYARAYAEQIDLGFSVSYANAYAQEIDDGKPPIYAYVFVTRRFADSSEEFARAYAEQFDQDHMDWHDADHMHWFAYEYAKQVDAGKSPEYARAYAEHVDAGFSVGYADAYAEMVDSGKSSEYARAYTDARYMYGLSETRAREVAEGVNPAPALTSPDLSDMDAVVVLAMYSTTDDTEANTRAASTREMTAYLERGDMDNETALGLLAEIVPGASIDERTKAASRLASISENSDGELTSEQSLQAANELTRLITGHGIDAEQRTEAAREMVRLSRSGELNADNAAELMDTIAPEWSVTERKEALGYLAWQFSEGEWDADSTQRTAEEGYTLITGGELRIERKMEASIDLAGEGLKRFGGDSYDDESVDQAVALTKGVISGDLSSNSISSILGLGTSESLSNTFDNDIDVDTESDAYQEAYHHKYHEVRTKEERCRWVTTYVGTQNWGCTSYYASWAHIWASRYAELIVRGESEQYADLYTSKSKHFSEYSKEYAHTYAITYIRQLGVSKSEIFADEYARHIADGKSAHYAHIVANLIILIGDSRENYKNRPSYFLANFESYIRTYFEQIDRGKPSGHALLYASLIDDRKSVEYAEAYTQMIGSGKSPAYAYAYTDTLIGSDKSPAYAQAYAHAVSMDSIASPRIYAEQIVFGKSSGYARIYTKQTVAGKSQIYTHAYTRQIVAGKSADYANIYATIADTGLIR